MKRKKRRTAKTKRNTKPRKIPTAAKLDTLIDTTELLVKLVKQIRDDLQKLTHGPTQPEPPVIGGKPYPAS